MQHQLGIKIFDLDGRAPKFVHEFSEELVVCLWQNVQGDQGYAVKHVGGILRTESFDEGVKTVYGPRQKSTVPGQYCPFEGCRKDTTQAYVRKASGYVLPQPHGRRQIFLPKSRTMTRQGERD